MYINDLPVRQCYVKSWFGCNVDKFAGRNLNVEYRFVTTEMTILSKVLGALVHIHLTNKGDKFGDFDHRHAK